MITYTVKIQFCFLVDMRTIFFLPFPYIRDTPYMCALKEPVRINVYACMYV